MEANQDSQVRMTIFSLDLLDNTGVTVSLFPAILKGITEEEKALLIEHARVIEKICFEAIQRVPEALSQPVADMPPAGAVVDFNEKKKDKLN
jgi:hypothetical protein